MSKKLKSLKNHSRKHRPLRIATKPKRVIAITSHKDLGKHDDKMTPGRLVAVGDWK